MRFLLILTAIFVCLTPDLGASVADSVDTNKTFKTGQLSGQTSVIDPASEDLGVVHWSFSMSHIEMAPFRASLIEPRFGLSKSFTTSMMKVDIGNAVDLARRSEFRSNGDTLNASLGIDFFTYVRVTGYQGLRLQVDAVDGLFGGHLTHSILTGSGVLQLRFRFLHLSSHYVDGHYDETTQLWKADRTPVPFTRDFADFTISATTGEIRAYAIVEHAFHIRPFAQKRTWYQAGGEWYFASRGGTGLHPYFAQDFRAVGFNSYVVNSTSMLGMKWGEVFGGGLDVFLRYYSGVGPSSEYYDIRSRELSLGFSIDYW